MLRFVDPLDLPEWRHMLEERIGILVEGLRYTEAQATLKAREILRDEYEHAKRLAGLTADPVLEK